MAEKKNEKKNVGVVRIMGKHLMAAQRCASRDESRPILRGVHLTAGEYGAWRIEATDTYRLVRIEGRDDTAVKATSIDVVVPPEALLGVKASDSVTFEPSADGTTCKVYRLNKRSGETVCEVRCVEGNYPNVDKLLPKKEIPRGCYRFAPTVNPLLLKDVMQAIVQSVGEEPVDVATLEDEAHKPVMLYAGNEDVRVTAIVMPIRPTSWMEKHSPLTEPRPKGKAEERNRELRDELRAAKANADMWKAKALESEKGGDAVKLAEELERVKADAASLKADLKKANAKAERMAKRAEQKGANVDDKRVKELEAELAEAKAAIADAAGKLKETRAELDDVWKENAKLKARREVPPAPKAPKEPTEAAAAVSLETMRAWCEERNLTLNQVREGCPIWVHGESLPYKKELEGMGFRWGTSKKWGKGWYLNPAEAA